jgi:D-glycero-D-manno-heptose 1,7-bisphosphate phosphatase
LVEPDLVELLAGVLEGLRLLTTRFRLGIITNQSAIARGIGTVEQVENTNKKVIELLSLGGVEIDFLLYCPHTPEDKCICRKPNPYYGNLAIKEFGIDAQRSFMIGDSESDIEFGHSLGLKTIRIALDLEQVSLAEYVTLDLIGAAGYISSTL